MSGSVKLACCVILAWASVHGTGISGPTRKGVVRWSGDVTLSQLDCRAEGAGEIRVTGMVTLHSLEQPKHLSDTVASRDRSGGVPPWIDVFCDRMTFEPQAEIASSANLDIRIRGMVSGQVRLIGQHGSEPPPLSAAPPTWSGHASAPGDNGADGAAGQPAQPPSAGLPSGSQARPGRHGDAGGPAQAAADGAHGIDGPNGLDANSLTLLAGSFAPDSTVDMISRGGAGGAGGRGGRGQDGGRGGNGGRGGSGGIALAGFAPGAGGDGGDGGDGGRGGNGGAGGSGGRGGAGGRLILGLRIGGAPPARAPYLDNRGGSAGEPGPGGQAGLGALGGQGGAGGPPGATPAAKPGVKISDSIEGLDDSSGIAGLAGQSGRYGAAGLGGPDGQAGQAGNTGYGSWGGIKGDRFVEITRAP